MIAAMISISMGSQGVQGLINRVTCSCAFNSAGQASIVVDM